MTLDMLAYAIIGIPIFLILSHLANKDSEDQGFLIMLCQTIIFTIMVLALASPFIGALVWIFGGYFNEFRL